MSKQEIRLVLESKISNIELLINAIRGICQSLVKDETLVYHLTLCAVEAVTNVIIHSYHKEPNRWVELNVTIEDQTIIFEVLDNGDTAPFPEFKNDLDISENNLELSENGRGLFLIHSLMDEVTHGQTSDKKNFFKMIKKIESTP